MGKERKIYWRHKGNKTWSYGVLLPVSMPGSLMKIQMGDHWTAGNVVVDSREIDYEVCPEEADFPEEG